MFTRLPQRVLTRSGVFASSARRISSSAPLQSGSSTHINLQARRTIPSRVGFWAAVFGVTSATGFFYGRAVGPDGGRSKEADVSFLVPNEPEAPRPDVVVPVESTQQQQEHEEQEAVDAGDVKTGVEEKAADTEGEEQEDEKEEKEEKRVEIERFDYVIVGWTEASAAAIGAIFRGDAEARVLIIDDETVVRPCQSQMNSQDLLTRDVYVKEGRAEVTSAKPVVVRPASHEVVLLDHRVVRYEKCLLTPGVLPRRIKDIDPSVEEHVRHYYSPKDMERATEAAQQGKTVVVVGGGIFGSDVAYTLADRVAESDNTIVQLSNEASVLTGLLPPYLSKHLKDGAADRGVDLHLDTKVVSIRSAAAAAEGSDDTPAQDGGDHGKPVVIVLDNGETIHADEVVIATGLVPNVDLARRSGLEVDNKRGGIVANAELSVRSDLYVAGEAMSYFLHSKARRRDPPLDPARYSGVIAGNNMMLPRTLKIPVHLTYNNYPSYASELGSDYYQVIGDAHPKHRTVSVWSKIDDDEEDAYQQGIVYYIHRENNKLVGAVMWNVPEVGPLRRSRKRTNATEEEKKTISVSAPPLPFPTFFAKEEFFTKVMGKVVENDEDLLRAIPIY
eukprot:TRINITY_DN2191_c0_g1_i1.p1 TRINITY_DN2191_c0_g1~~TRINITY_DN2191_c0_g1_i1.p1  ORF type:complete len:615 (+),score=173.14 TRINITY_DN2191_c0_g1_i1:139-1983(+)